MSTPLAVAKSHDAAPNTANAARSKSRRRSAAILIVVLGSLLFLFTPLRYFCIGLVRGEHFYQGFPTSFWRDAIETHVTSDHNFFRPTWEDRVRIHLGLPTKSDLPLVLRGGREAVGVLSELVEDANPLVRARACNALAQLGPAAADALPALRKLASSEDPVVSYNSWQALKAIDYVPGAEPKTRQRLEDSKDYRGE